MEVKGIITEVMAVVGGESANGHWERQEFVVSFGSVAYPQSIVLTVSGADRIKQMDLHRGIKGTFVFSTEAQQGRTGERWFNNFRCYKYEPMGKENAPQTAEEANAAGAQAQDNNNDLPY